MSCIVQDIELASKDVINELGFFIDGSVRGFSFRPPKIFNSNKQTIWNTSHLQVIAWRACS